MRIFRPSVCSACPGRAERLICVDLRSFAVEFRPENGDLDRKWTQMNANGGGERPKTVIFSRKTGRGHENRRGRGNSSCFPEHFLFSCFGFMDERA